MIIDLSPYTAMVVRDRLKHDYQQRADRPLKTETARMRQSARHEAIAALDTALAEHTAELIAQLKR